MRPGGCADARVAECAARPRLHKGCNAGSGAPGPRGRTPLAAALLAPSPGGGDRGAAGGEGRCGRGGGGREEGRGGGGISPARGTWLEMRSSQTERAIWMALGLWVTEVALSWSFQVPCRLLAWFTASRKICSCFLVLSTAPMLTILGSQPARAKEEEKSRASSSSRMVLIHGRPGARRAPPAPPRPPRSARPHAGPGPARGALRGAEPPVRFPPLRSAPLRSAPRRSAPPAAGSSRSPAPRCRSAAPGPRWSAGGTPAGPGRCGSAPPGAAAGWARHTHTQNLTHTGAFPPPPPPPSGSCCRPGPGEGGCGAGGWLPHRWEVSLVKGGQGLSGAEAPAAVERTSWASRSVFSTHIACSASGYPPCFGRHNHARYWVKQGLLQA